MFLRRGVWPDPGRPDEVARLVGARIAEDIPFLTGETLYIDGAQAITH